MKRAKVVYYTVRIPYDGMVGVTVWHPLTMGETLTRGAFRSRKAARNWARAHLDGHPYAVMRICY